MNLAYKKILGKFTKILGFGKNPPHVGKNSQIISFFFMRAYLTAKRKVKYKTNTFAPKAGFHTMGISFPLQIHEKKFFSLVKQLLH